MRTIMATAAVAVAVLVTVAFAAPGALRAQADKGQEKKVQLVKLSFDDKGYVVTPSSVTKGIPVKMEVDLDTVKAACAPSSSTPST